MLDSNVMAAVLYALADEINDEGAINVNFKWPFPDEDWQPPATELGQLLRARAYLSLRIVDLEEDSGNVTIGVPTAHMGLHVPGS